MNHIPIKTTDEDMKETHNFDLTADDMLKFVDLSPFMQRNTSSIQEDAKLSQYVK